MGCVTDYIQSNSNRLVSGATRGCCGYCLDETRPQDFKLFGLERHQDFKLSGLELVWFDGEKSSRGPSQASQAMSCEQIPNNTYNVDPYSPLKEKNLPRDPNARSELARFDEFFRQYPMLKPAAAEQYRIATLDVDQNKRVSIGDLFYIEKKGSESCWAVSVHVTPANLRYFQGARVIWTRKPPEPIVQR